MYVQSRCMSDKHKTQLSRIGMAAKTFLKQKQRPLYFAHWMKKALFNCFLELLKKWFAIQIVQ